MGENNLGLHLSIRRKRLALKGNSDIPISDRLWSWYKCSYSCLQGKTKPFSEARFFFVTLDSWFSLALTHPVWRQIFLALCFYPQVCWITCFFNSERNRSAYSVIGDINYTGGETFSAINYIYIDFIIHIDFITLSSTRFILRNCFAGLGEFFSLEALLKEKRSPTLVKHIFPSLAQFACKMLGQFN